MDRRAAWVGLGGVVIATCGTNAAAWAVGAATAGSHLPLWPAYMFGALALGGVYITASALAGWWPLHRLSMAPAELLDNCIRQGMAVRERVVYQELDSWQAASEAAEWTLYTSNRLHEHYPRHRGRVPAGKWGAGAVLGAGTHRADAGRQDRRAGARSPEAGLRQLLGARV